MQFSAWPNRSWHFTHQMIGGIRTHQNRTQLAHSVRQQLEQQPPQRRTHTFCDDSSALPFDTRAILCFRVSVPAILARFLGFELFPSLLRLPNGEYTVSGCHQRCRHHQQQQQQQRPLKRHWSFVRLLWPLSAALSEHVMEMVSLPFRSMSCRVCAMCICVP